MTTTALKKALPSEDILSYEFETADDVACAIVYTDGIVNKQLLGDLIARPLSRLSLLDTSQKDIGRYETNKKNTDDRSGHPCYILC